MRIDPHERWMLTVADPATGGAKTVVGALLVAESLFEQRCGMGYYVVALAGDEQDRIMHSQRPRSP